MKTVDSESADMVQVPQGSRVVILTVAGTLLLKGFQILPF